MREQGRGQDAKWRRKVSSGDEGLIGQRAEGEGGVFRDFMASVSVEVG